MPKLTKNFTLEECLHSDTAIRKGIDNTPSEKHYQNIIWFLEEIMQPIRDAYGKPITVTSMYRSRALNDAIGGSKTSAHMKGLAMDVQTKDITGLLKFLEKNIKKFDIDQLISEFPDKSGTPRWIHIGATLPGKPRNQKLVARSVGGKTVYSKT